MVYEDICELNSINNKNNNYWNLIGIKSANNNKLKFEYQNIRDPKKLYFQKKKDMEDEKIKYNKDYLEFCTYLNRLYVDSTDSNCPLDIFLIDPKNQIQEQFQENEKNQMILKNEQFDDKFMDIMKGNMNNNMYFNDNIHFRKDSFNSELSFFDNNSNINI